MPDTTYSVAELRAQLVASKSARQQFLSNSWRLDAEAPCCEWPFWRDPQGYGRVRLADGVHRTAQWVVCYLRHGPPPEPDWQAAHSCHNSGCVNGGHLRWLPPIENIRESVARGAHAHGERHARAKMTEALVREARALWDGGTVTLRALCAKYGLGVGPMHRLVTRKNWRNVR